MICAVLAAGYATRLYPLTENYPKPLLEVRGKTILDWLLDDIESSGKISEYVIISNHKYAHHFEDWAKTKPYKITVVDDGTSTNETRLGAVRDISYTIEKLSIVEDMLVIAGDNVLDFSLTHFISYATSHNTSCVMRYFEGSAEKLKKCGVATVDKSDLITDMKEKPQVPESNWCIPPFYYYTEKDTALVAKGIADGCATDAPGSFIAWLCKQTAVHAMVMPGSRYDIGNIQSYQNVKLTYKGIEK